jgi:hypothetical protein
MRKPGFGLLFCLSSLLGSSLHAASAAPPIRHVFLIVLENESADDTFGPHTDAKYLARDLPKHGAFLPQYYGIGHNSLDNYIAMVSGQGPNPVTQEDCQSFTAFQLASSGADGQAVGSGCVYPSSVPNLADQLTKQKLTWKSYSEDMGLDPQRDGGVSCGHPALNAPDGTQKAQAAAPGKPLDQYATRHNPFMYFSNIIDDVPYCQAHAVNFHGLVGDLKSVSTTANFIFITPNLCNDGHDAKCVSNKPGGMKAADAFLRLWVPIITKSPAFRKDGLLVITFDEAEVDDWNHTDTKINNVSGDASSCCGEVTGPNIAQGSTVFGSPDYAPGLFGPGGGRIGAVLLSPFIKGGAKSDTTYNHYALLKTIEDIFGLDHLGYAAGADVKSIADDANVFRPRQ